MRDTPTATSSFACLFSLPTRGYTDGLRREASWLPEAAGTSVGCADRSNSAANKTFAVSEVIGTPSSTTRSRPSAFNRHS